MITFAFDNIHDGVLIPNLRSPVTDPSEYETTAPYSKEFGFLRYLESECISHRCVTTATVQKSSVVAVYPMHLTCWDSSIDYFGLMSESALALCRTGQLRPLFYFSMGVDINAVHEHLLSKMTKYGIEHANLRVILPNFSSSKPGLIHFSDHESDARYSALDSVIVSHVNVRERPKTFSSINHYDSNFGALLAGSMWYHGLTMNGHFEYRGLAPLNSADKVSTNVLKWNKHWADTPELIENFRLHVPFATADKPETPTGIYTDAYWNVVIAGQCDRTTAHVPRSVFDPIMNMQPFMVVGPQYSLRTLRDMGYATFSEWMDEGYDRIKSDEERLNVCFQMIYDIATLSHKEHVHMMKEMIPTLAHNQGVLMASKKEQYLAAINILLGS